MKIEEYKPLREKLGLTQQQVANDLNTHVGVISQIERGVKERTTKKSLIQEKYKEYILEKVKKSS